MAESKDSSCDSEARLKGVSVNIQSGADNKENADFYRLSKDIAKNSRDIALQVAGATPACIINENNALLEFNNAFGLLVKASAIVKVDMCRVKPRLSFTHSEYSVTCQTLLQKIFDREIPQGGIILSHGKGVWQITVDELMKFSCSKPQADYFTKRQFLMRFAEISASPSLDDSIRILPKIFGLTPAETNLCGALLETYSLPAAAQRLSVKNSTARTQLKSIFAKTKVNSQTALIAKLTLLLARQTHQ